MKKFLPLAIGLFLLGTLSLSAVSHNATPIAYQQDAEPARLMKLFLNAIQSNDENEVKKFITDNYSKRFLEIPVNVHQKVINGLHRDFVHHIVVQTIVNDNKITVTIKSPINKTKQITIETDKGSPAKILIVNARD